ncbi:hypothetical protein ACWEFJ_23495 [Actinosynnema sp. NPDC004786]
MARPLSPAPGHPAADPSVAHALVAESSTADLIVTGSQTGADRALALAVAASARCPVVAVPPGGAWRGDLPALIGVDEHLAVTTALTGFALAAVLGTGLRAVRCTGGRPAAGTPGAPAVLGDCARRHPGVPVDARVARSHPVSGLLRHARLAALLVVGCTPTGERSTSRRLLDRSPVPVVLVGPRVADREPAAGRDDVTSGDRVPSP